MKRRIFIVNQQDNSQQYGVGKYVDEIIHEVRLKKDVYKLVYIDIGVNNIISIQKKIVDNVTYLKIPKTFDSNKTQNLSYYYLKSIYIILNNLYVFKDSDIFHFNSVLQCGLLKSIKNFTKSKIIYTIHVSLWKVYYHNNYNKFITAFNSDKHLKNINFEIECCKLSNKVICLSESMKKDVIKIYKIPENKVFKISNGIREELLSNNDFKSIDNLKKKYEIKKTDFVFLYVGRIIAQKGIEALLDVFKIQNESNNIKLLILGDGSLKAKLEKESMEFANIIFAGYIPKQEIKWYYKLANSFISTSLNEQSSYVVLEAMSFKIPMILTNIDAFAFLRHGYSCLKTEVLKTESKIDIDSLNKNISVMVNDKRLTENLAKNAYKLFKKSFSAKLMVEKTYFD